MSTCEYFVEGTAIAHVTGPVPCKIGIAAVRVMLLPDDAGRVIVRHFILRIRNLLRAVQAISHLRAAAARACGQFLDMHCRSCMAHMREEQ